MKPAGSVSNLGALLFTGIGVATIAAVAVFATIAQPVMAAQVCYEDDRGRIVNRRRPGYLRVECPQPEADNASDRVEGSTARAAGEEKRVDYGLVRGRNKPSAVPCVGSGRSDCVASAPTLDCKGGSQNCVTLALPDRWRVVENLDAFREEVGNDSVRYQYPWWDPYNRNVLKGDRPVNSNEWFFSINALSDTLLEVREVPTPVGAASTANPGGVDIFGDSDQFFINQNIAAEFVYLKGDTVFRPPDHEFRFTPVLNINYLDLEEVQGVNARASRGTNRTDHHLGIQAAFYDRHLRNVGDRYDFDSIRIGIQPFNSDFRGFLFQDNQLGIRLFGNRNNNIFQYNLAYFRRLEKDTNSGLNDVTKDIRKDDVVAINAYWQDFPRLGFVSQATVVYNRNREDNTFFFDNNDFIARPASLGDERPRKYDVVYFGYNGDGHFGRLNLTTSAYYAVGSVSPGVFEEQKVDISAGFFAAEAGFDMDWLRFRASFLYGSGDNDPFDDKATGFDAIFENPVFAGSDTSYWLRQAVPLIGGGRVALSTRNGLLNNLRSSKEQGQSNFTNPGMILAGIGADADLLPSLRLSFNYNYLRFDHTEVLETVRNQGSIDEEIGHDLSASLIWRPLVTQNIVLRTSYAHLFPGQGYRDLFPDEDAGYFMMNLVLAF